jgi:hypothetical protein
MSKTLIGPAYGHIFCSGSVEAEVTSIRERCKIQGMVIGLGPLTVRADGVVAGSSAAAEGCNDDDKEKQPCHNSLTPDSLQSSLVCSLYKTPESRPTAVAQFSIPPTAVGGLFKSFLKAFLKQRSNPAHGSGRILHVLAIYLTQ